MHTTKTAIITGATGAIGKAIGLGMASQGYKTILFVRNKEKAEVTVREIKEKTGNINVEYIVVDVSRKKEIQKAAQDFNEALHVLINNAAVTPRQREETPEGIEMQWATNVLGYFWMIQYFLPHLQKSSPARIVNVASFYAGGLDLNDPEYKKRHYNNDEAYRQSKQANRMMTYAFAEQLSNQNITVNTCHPGEVNSQLSNNLGFGGHESPEVGAATPIWLAVDKIGEKTTGGFFGYKKKENCKFASDKKGIEDLFKMLTEFGGY